MNVPKLRFPEFRDAGEWENSTLLEIAKFRRGSFPQPYGLPEWYDKENGMPFVQVFDVNDDLRLKTETKSKISKQGAEQSVFIPKGTLIVTLQGSIGRVAITQYDAYIDRTLLIFESFHKPIEKLFFAYVVQNLFEIEKQKAPGGIIKTITKEVLSDFKVKLPEHPEQQKIADCLSSINDRITAETQKLDTLKAHKKGLMQQLFPAEGETLPKLRFPEFRDAEEWTRKLGDEITIKITKGSSPNWQGFSYQSEGILFITSENVRDGFVDVSNPKYLPEEFYKKQQNSHLSYGDILINIVGASIGRSCLYLLEYKAFINQAVALFRVHKNIYFQFISYYYQTDEMQREMFGTQSESARPNLSLTDLKNIKFHLPSFVEQQRIADCLSSLDNLITAQTQKIDTLKTHKKGLMQQLFPSIEEVKR